MCNEITNANVKAGFNFIPNGVEEKNLYFYHPDHLGSSSYITDKEGQVIQHTEYMAFGEVLVDEHSVSNKQPYLFNGKELDFETGLYYYGARYYDPKVSLWLNTDPLSGYNPVQETEHYIDGQHNGGVFNPMNMATYSYTYQNPIRYIDPNGKQVDVVDFIPVVGSGRDIYRGIRDGDALTFGIGVVGLVADVATLGSGTVIKGGLKAGVKIGIKEFGESTIKTGSKRILKNADEIAEGVKFEADEIAKAISEGKDVTGRVRLVPKNGKGNIKGNRTDVDQLIKNDDGTYTIVETKRSSKTPLSKGQNAAKKQIEQGNGTFEVRTEKNGLKKEQIIKVKEYNRINKYE